MCIYWYNSLHCYYCRQNCIDRKGQRLLNMTMMVNVVDWSNKLLGAFCIDWGSSGSAAANIRSSSNATDVIGVEGDSASGQPEGVMPLINKIKKPSLFSCFVGSLNFQLWKLHPDIWVQSMWWLSWYQMKTPSCVTEHPTHAYNVINFITNALKSRRVR